MFVLYGSHKTCADSAGGLDEKIVEGIELTAFGAEAEPVKVGVNLAVGSICPFHVKYIADDLAFIFGGETSGAFEVSFPRGGRSPRLVFFDDLEDARESVAIEGEDAEIAVGFVFGAQPVLWISEVDAEDENVALVVGVALCPRESLFERGAH